MIMAGEGGSGATGRIDTLIFDRAPVAAIAERDGPCRVVRTYLGHVNAKRARDVSRLFAKDFVFISPTGQIIKNHSDVESYYSTMLAKRSTHLVPVSILSAGHVCVMELATRTDPEDFYRLSAMDHFTINDIGEIERLVIYVQPGSIVPFSKKDLEDLEFGKK